MHLIDILEEHAEEAAFLWMQRQSAVRSWNYTPKDLAELDERLLAHIDGLLIGEDAAAEILQPYLTGREEGEAFAAAYVALASGSSDRERQVVDAFDAAEGETLDGIRHAFRHTANADAVRRIGSYLEHEEPRLVAAAIDVLSYRRMPDPFGPAHFFSDRPPIVRAAAIEAAGRMGARDYLPRVEQSLTDPDAGVQRAALRTAFLFGSERVLEVARELVSRRAVNADEAVHLLGLAGVRSDQALIFGAVRDERLQPYAILALGAHGYANVITPLLELAKDLKDLRGVGCVVSRITGVDIEDDDLESWAEVEAARTGKKITAAELEAEFTGLTDEPYEGLPPPDLDKLTVWWSKNSNRFDSGVPLRDSQPIGQDLLKQILEKGFMPERHDTAMELSFIGVATDIVLTEESRGFLSLSTTPMSHP